MRKNALNWLTDAELLGVDGHSGVVQDASLSVGGNNTRFESEVVESKPILTSRYTVLLREA
jgi:hypothetical protein